MNWSSLANALLRAMLWRACRSLDEIGGAREEHPDPFSMRGGRREAADPRFAPFSPSRCRGECNHCLALEAIGAASNEVSSVFASSGEVRLGRCGR